MRITKLFAWPLTGGSNAIRIFDSALQSYAESVRTPNNSVIMELFQWDERMYPRFFREVMTAPDEAMARLRYVICTLSARELA